VGILCPMVGITCLGLASACPPLWDWWEEEAERQRVACLSDLDKLMNLIRLVGRV